jgi:hypothetical protein
MLAKSMHCSRKCLEFEGGGDSLVLSPCALAPGSFVVVFCHAKFQKVPKSCSIQLFYVHTLMTGGTNCFILGNLATGP